MNNRNGINGKYNRTNGSICAFLFHVVTYLLVVYGKIHLTSPYVTKGKNHIFYVENCGNVKLTLLFVCLKWIFVVRWTSITAYVCVLLELFSI